MHKIVEQQKLVQLLSVASSPNDPYEIEVIENTLPTTELKDEYRSLSSMQEEGMSNEIESVVLKENFSKKCPNDGNSEESLSSSDESQHENEIDNEALKNYESEIGNIYSYFGMFKAWLMSIDGGNKPERLASAYVAQVLAIHKAINGDEGHILELADSKMIRDNWLSKFMKERKPGTINAYLHSLLYFYSYLITQKPFGSKGNQTELV